jgi:hypothetical protein
MAFLGNTRKIFGRFPANSALKINAINSVTKWRLQTASFTVVRGGKKVDPNGTMSGRIFCVIAYGSF